MKHLLPFFALFLMSVGLFTAQTCHAQAVLRAGDTVEIRLSGVNADEAATFSAPQTIDEGGMLNIPYVGKVKVAGSDSSQVQQLIETKLKTGKIYSNPTVTLIIQGASRLVNVTGEVKQSGRVQYSPDLTVLSAIGAAGGFTDFADKKRVRLSRDGKVKIIDTTKASRDPSKDEKVLPGDQINVVPTSGPFGIF